MSQRTPQNLQRVFDHPGNLLLRFLHLFLNINVWGITSRTVVVSGTRHKTSDARMFMHTKLSKKQTIIIIIIRLITLSICETEEWLGFMMNIDPAIEPYNTHNFVTVPQLLQFEGLPLSADWAWQMQVRTVGACVWVCVYVRERERERKLSDLCWARMWMLMDEQVLCVTRSICVQARVHAKRCARVDHLAEWQEIVSIKYDYGEAHLRICRSSNTSVDQKGRINPYVHCGSASTRNCTSTCGNFRHCRWHWTLDSYSSLNEEGSEWWWKLIRRTGIYV